LTSRHRISTAFNGQSHFKKIAASKVLDKYYSSYLRKYTQSPTLRGVTLRNHWWGGARKRINQKGSKPGSE
jgi:hypothetical protein